MNISKYVLPKALLVCGLIGCGAFAAEVSKVKALPDDPACTAEDRKFIARTYELARASTAKGDGGHGALLVKDGKVLLEFASMGTTSGDVTKHAEIGVISLGSRQLGREALAGTILYTSEEPCIMCCGAVRSAGIRTFIYGATAFQAQRLRGGPLSTKPLQCRETFARLDYSIKIIGPLMEEEGLQVLAENYEMRARKKK
ncbi:MAG: nucleoside deaminase [Verrucomicrobiota bacterium]